MPVNSTHPQYDDAILRWRRNRDAISGQDAIKRGGELYLPRPNADDDTKANLARYERYLERALWYAAPERTKASLIGSVFRRGPEVQEMVPQIEYILEDADGTGTSLEQVSKEIVGELLEVGRFGVLVDYPEAAPGLSLEEIERRAIRASFSTYSAESIINWRVEKDGGRYRLTLVVLHECVDKGDDDFRKETVSQWRVLRLVDGLYVQEVYDTNLQQVTAITPRQSNGQPWQEIPFLIFGAETNRADVDKAPLTHLCNHAIAYWQTSADHRENLYMHGQLTLGISSDLDVDQWQQANPNGVQVGAPVGVFLGPGGGFHTAHAPESTALSKALEDLRTEMSELGAQIIQQGNQAETAEAARIDASAESSVLSNVVGNASEGIEQCLEWVALYMGGDPKKVLFKLNTEFFDDTLDAQTRTVMLAEMDRGLISKNDYRASLRKSGALAADRTDEDIDDDVQQQGPSLGVIE